MLRHFFRPALAGVVFWFGAGISSIVWSADSAVGTHSRQTATSDNRSSSPREESAREKEQEYRELLDLFADTLEQVDRNYVKDVDRRELMEAALHGMMSKLDPYSDYIPPSEVDRFRNSVEDKFGGVGVTVSVESGRLQVVTPLVGSPAYRAGVRSGDCIIEIEGQSTAEITLDEALRQMKGPLGTSVKLTLERATDGSQVSLELVREMVHLDSILGVRRNADDTWDFLLDPKHRIGYVRISTFSRHTSDDLDAALRKLQNQGSRGLILDVRFNPGGLLTSAIEVSDLFLAHGRIVSTSGRSGPQRIWDARKPGTFEGFPMVVLVNHTSASASEIVAASLQDHKRAVVVGERTWGKGSVQNVIELERGRSALKLTTAGYLRPSGKNIHRFQGAKEADEWGVRPDPGLEVLLTREEDEACLAEYRRQEAIVDHVDEAMTAAPTLDRQLQAAVDYLNKQLARPQPSLATAERK